MLLLLLLIQSFDIFFKLFTIHSPLKHQFNLPSSFSLILVGSCVVIKGSKGNVYQMSCCNCQCQRKKYP